MGTGWLAWACLVLGSAAPADDVFHYNKREFLIPITVKPESRASVSLLVLYCSRDQGATWDMIGRSTPDKPGFDYRAVSDGLHWFSIAVMDTKGAMDPPDVKKAPPGQKILIDTAAPAMKLTAERVGDEIQAIWEATEDHPDWATFRLECRMGDAPGGAWTPLAVHAPGNKGIHRFKPASAGAVSVRVAMKDKAGNEGSDEKAVAPARTDSSVTRVAGPEMLSLPGVGAAPLPPPGTAIGGTATGGNPPAIAGSNGGTPAPAKGQMPDLRIVSRDKVKLGFDVLKFGPSGLGSVEVYRTADDGETWEPVRQPMDVVLPPTQPAPGGPPAFGSVMVDLPDEGRAYGFILVVKSKAGMGDPAPKAGQVPQVRLERDTTPPRAVLLMPGADAAHPDRLVFTWEAEDRNLAANPITLEWAEKVEGPWNLIGDAQMANTRRYVWHPTGKMPERAFLRLTVRDKAGNPGVARTATAQVLDVIKPVVGDVRVVD